MAERIDVGKSGRSVIALLASRRSGVGQDGDVGGERRAGTVSVRVLPPDDWRVLRRLRTAALADAADALGSSPGSADRWTERHWRGWPARGVPLAAFQAEDAVGLVGVVMPSAASLTASLVALWVSPDARGVGVGDALVEAVTGVARGWGCRWVELEVLSGNEPAIRLYRRHGFTLSEQAATTPGAFAMRLGLA